MKYTLLFLIVTVGYSQDSMKVFEFGGSYIGGSLFGNGGSELVKSKIVIDSVVYKGNGETFHQWVNEYNEPSRVGCLVNHGILGCPDNWTKGYRICRICYRKEYFHEERWVETIKSEIETLNEIVDSLRSKQ